ncbi:hypothetical protein P5V15_014108 [Pogonomyrmex californicus]
MTSMFDQYEQASQRSKQVLAPPIRPDISTAGFIQMKLQDDGPIFTKQKVNFLPSDKILHLVVSSNIIVIAMANNILLRIDMKQPDKTEEIDISKYALSMKMSGLFLDPLGHHLLIILMPRHGDNPPPELFYLHRKTTKLRQASKFKGHEITAVGWNFSNVSETCSGPILLGTSKGLIFETEIGLETDKIFNMNLEQYWRQVFDIGKNSKPPITGIEFHKIPNSDKYMIIVTTLMRIYQYIGTIGNPEEKPLLQQVFYKYLNAQESFSEVINSLPYSRMQFYYPSLGVLPKSFGWLTEAGILYAQVDAKPNTNNVLINQQMLTCPETSLIGSNVSKITSVPFSFVLTEFHALLLYPDHVKGISLLNQELIFEDVYNDAVGKLIGITKDPATRSIWAYSERAVFKYKVTKEDRNVWQVYVDKSEFDLAKRYCGNNPAHIDQVLIKQAEMLFKNKEYEKSALIYADTHSSFEEISLKFLQEWQIEALKTFLRKAKEIIKYLEFCVYKQGSQEQAIHNFLLSLYACYKQDEVMRYISSQGQDISMVHYDVHYALRLCQEEGLTEACVQLSALLGLWTTAVDLALTINVDLAKQIAAMPSDHDDELRKKLWLKIAEHVVREKDDIQQAMEFLQHCDLVRIEDILPFFSDFVTIDHFKEAICSSLQEYNQHIQDLKEEMQEATKAAELIRKDIQAFRTRCTFVHARDTCNTCEVQLLLRSFYVFPCGHKFHSDCLVAALTPMLSMDQRTKLADLQQQLTAISNRSEDTTSTTSVSLSRRDQIKVDIDELVASECLYCGELMIESIDKPFIEEEDYERVMKEWT